jgi:hypothetical protein
MFKFTAIVPRIVFWVYPRQADRRRPDADIARTMAAAKGAYLARPSQSALRKPASR